MIRRSSPWLVQLHVWRGATFLAEEVGRPCSFGWPLVVHPDGTSDLMDDKEIREWHEQVLPEWDKKDEG